MARLKELKRLNKKTRNKLRAILNKDQTSALGSLATLRGTLGKDQAEALDAILNGLKYEKVIQASTPFPKNPSFADKIRAQPEAGLEAVLKNIEVGALAHKARLLQIGRSLHLIDQAYGDRDIDSCCRLIAEAIDSNGWSHALLRRIVLIRENLPEGEEDERIEALVQQADLSIVAVTSLVHSYSLDQSFLTIKRSILNIADRGAINRFSRAIARLPVQPFARSKDDLSAFLAEVQGCSLIDAVIVAKFNAHLYSIDDYPTIAEVTGELGCPELFERLVRTYDPTDNESEYTFFKQSSAWLEYEPVRQYRILLDNYFDASRDKIDDVPDALAQTLTAWVGEPTLKDLVGKKPFTKHIHAALANLELTGFATRSAVFNYWLHKSEGQIGFDKEDLLTLMGLTRDLARTVPINATRTAAKLAKDQLVRLILLLLLAKRSKNELDGFLLKWLLEEIAIKDHNGSLVKLVSSYEMSHPYVAEYIYDIATEDFLAKWTAPRQVDNPGLSFEHRRQSMSAQRFTPEFKEEAVKQVTEKGLSVAEVAVRLGVSTHSLYKWVKAVSPVRSEQQSQELLEAKSEILRLRSQMRRIEEERDILKKAVRYLAREPE